MAKHKVNPVPGAKKAPVQEERVPFQVWDHECTPKSGPKLLTDEEAAVHSDRPDEVTP